MKPGLCVGQKEEVVVTVTKDMCAAFGGQPVHDLYSTSTLVHHMEWAARKTILPYLEDHEEGMGYHVEVSHSMLSLPGMEIKIVATVSEIRDNKVICEVEAVNPRGRIARGSVTQVIIEKSWLDKKMKEVTLVQKLEADLEAASNT